MKRFQRRWYTSGAETFKERLCVGFDSKIRKVNL